ncbi:hypothetical protein CDG77_14010 [Nostoc sp. 'Peltigera membranacea cyanobiont' 213]|uniref:hypothetical protein n=1 Tax=Nostoc sp. 'Peltigera membranacea cyanobiont' 213 TaxID=2014530 RepID=UPI000B95BB34|nr:hypothetical protein [Nostoc sp. 'Peltigera membranacea cyanobiont' 213]OYD92763.1 hypothetical protein CDG77_14010 [Nostoc sp. 'Peltigera membranacea cyanobiont' 213]
MAEPTIVQIFGTGAARLANGDTVSTPGLFIPDSSLTSTGLTTPTTATAEGHLTAIVKKAESYLTQSNFDSNIDQSLIVGTGYPSFVNRGTDNTQYRVDQKTLSLAKIDTGSTINPGDY